jgi:hypothetical protein
MPKVKPFHLNSSTFEESNVGGKPDQVLVYAGTTNAGRAAHRGVKNLKVFHLVVGLRLGTSTRSCAWQRKKIAGHFGDGFSSYTTNHELSALLSIDESGNSEFFDMERDCRTEFVASCDMTADFSDGHSLNLMDIAGLFYGHGTIFGAQKLKYSSPRRITESPKEGSYIGFDHVGIIPLHI